MGNIEMIKQLMNKKISPQKILMDNLIPNNNPMIKNLIDMAQKGNSKGIEQFARNIMKERNMDFDKEFADFMQKIQNS